MKIVLPGGSGQVGRILCRAFARDGHDVVVLSRAPSAGPWRTVPWDGGTLGAWAAEIDGADVVVNLAGHTVNCRYGARNRERILRSRVDSARVVGAAIARCARPPHTWLQASTATIYAHRFDAANDERTGLLGGSEPGTPSAWRFSIAVATEWERAVAEAATPRTRKVLLRSALTLSPDRGGIFDVLLGLVRAGLGGAAAGGRQYVSWIHHEDFVRAVSWLIERTELDGPVNLAAPEPLPHADFMRALREAWGARFGLPASRWMLAIGTFFLRTETELILKSRRVFPRRLLDSGFTFLHPHWPEAARLLCAEWRGATGGGAPSSCSPPRTSSLLSRTPSA